MELVIVLAAISHFLLFMLGWSQGTAYGMLVGQRLHKLLRTSTQPLALPPAPQLPLYTIDHGKVFYDPSRIELSQLDCCIILIMDALIRRTDRSWLTSGEILWDISPSARIAFKLEMHTDTAIAHSLSIIATRLGYMEQCCVVDSIVEPDGHTYYTLRSDE